MGVAIHVYIHEWGSEIRIRGCHFLWLLIYTRSTYTTSCIMQILYCCDIVLPWYDIVFCTHMHRFFPWVQLRIQHSYQTVDTVSYHNNYVMLYSINHEGYERGHCSDEIIMIGQQNLSAQSDINVKWSMLMILCLTKMP